MSYAMARAADFLDEWLACQIIQTGAVGLSTAVYYKGKIVSARAYGKSDIAKDKPLSNEHVFNIGSLSKIFTAIMVIQLAEDGALSVHDRAVRYLPWLSKHRDNRMRGITISQLLSHRAGLARDGAHAPYWQLEGKFPDAKALERLVLSSDIVLDNYAPFKYSNLGYALLGQIIEAVGGMSYAERAEKHIIRPLGLTNAFPEYSQSMEHRIATGYTRPIHGSRRAIPRALPTKTFASVAGWYANAHDIARLFASYFSGDSTLLSPASKRHLWSAGTSHWVAEQQRRTEYGAGLMAYTIMNRKVIGHGGGFYGYTSLAFYDPGSQAGIVILTNSKDAPLADIARGAFDIINFFLEKAPEPTPDKYSSLHLRAANLYMPMAMVPTSKHIVAVNLNAPLPFTKAEELEYVSPTVLMVKKASDIAAQGEPVTLHYKDGQLQFINYAGQTLRPEPLFTDWLEANLP